MEADFDPEDKYSWYFGPLSREESSSILENQREGVFLVRTSKTVKGGFVLCVKENRISQYIINRIQVGGMTRFKIGDIEFDNIPSLLRFYRSHYLDTTTLIKPAPRILLIGKFDFPGRDAEDLPFKKSEELELISKDEDDWWMARNRNGRVGQIPAVYVTVLQGTSQDRIEEEANEELSARHSQPQPSTAHDGDRGRRHTIPSGSVWERRLPALAKVTRDRIASPYNKEQLTLKKGEIIKVLSISIDGQWDGEVDGRTGKFPFTHIEFLPEDY